MPDDYPLFKHCAPGFWLRGKLMIRDSVEPIKGRKYVYQKVQPGLGNVECAVNKDLQLRFQPEMIDPQSPAQLTQRQKLIDANNAWKLLTQEEKNYWDAKRNARNLPGYQLYLSTMMR